VWGHDDESRSAQVWVDGQRIVANGFVKRRKEKDEFRRTLAPRASAGVKDEKISALVLVELLFFFLVIQTF
jgi:hypothetical protein